jgi:hypothetical protein
MMDLPSNSGSAHFHISWLFDFIFYQKPLYKSLHQSFFYSFITILPSETEKVVLHSITARFSLRPYDFVISSERACATSPLFGQGTTSYFFFLMVICNSLLLLKSLPINIINCIKFYVIKFVRNFASEWFLQ